MNSKRHNDTSALIVGGGVAGIVAALDLAETGRDVYLVEQGACLGGQVARLDKLYPTDHCAFCPLWTDIKKVQRHPKITVYCRSTVQAIAKEEGGYRALIGEKPNSIDEGLCVFCGRCREACPEDAVRPVGEHVYPPSYLIDPDTCTRCEDCITVCPTGAIDLDRSAVEISLLISEVIWATGFGEVDLSPLPEFGVGSHPDIMTSLEFEEWTAEAGLNRGKIVQKSTGEVPRAIAFIQCAGARDMRMLPYCSSVCCMHAIKQAQWVKRRNPEIACYIFYTDLRTVGRDYYEYSLRELRDSPIMLVRGRPGLIHPLPSTDAIAVKYENTETQKREIARFDMVVLNGNLRPSAVRTADGGHSIPSCSKEGFVDVKTDKISRFACGFTLEPTDVAESSIQASSVAARVSIERKVKNRTHD